MERVVAVLALGEPGFGLQVALFADRPRGAAGRPTGEFVASVIADVLGVEQFVLGVGAHLSADPVDNRNNRCPVEPLVGDVNHLAAGREGQVGAVCELLRGDKAVEVCRCAVVEDH